nr:PREDICTED: capZ-interacting protein-like [Latimeria chalumnae]|eukprot:XP_006013075.1 PREDICTED: capZ-interacting protein-like [Latimeria chalumnae]
MHIHSFVNLFLNLLLLKLRLRGSLKRRPPSRKFRKSQTEATLDGNSTKPDQEPQENGAAEENDEVFGSQGNKMETPLLLDQNSAEQPLHKVDQEQKHSEQQQEENMTTQSPSSMEKDVKEKELVIKEEMAPPTGNEEEKPLSPDCHCHDRKADSTSSEEMGTEPTFGRPPGDIKTVEMESSGLKETGCNEEETSPVKEPDTPEKNLCEAKVTSQNEAD